MNNNTQDAITCTQSDSTTQGTISAGSACSNYESDFNITMKFDSNATFVMYGQSYMHNTTNPSGQVDGCIWGFVDANTTGNDFFIGEQFVTQYYTIFDPDNNSMGFGVSVNSPTSTGPWLLFSAAAKTKLSAGAVVGITFGVIAAVAILGFLSFKLIQKQRASKNRQSNAAYSEYLETASSEVNGTDN
jgi:hypothetical protein